MRAREDGEVWGQKGWYAVRFENWRNHNDAMVAMHEAGEKDGMKVIDVLVSPVAASPKNREEESFRTQIVTDVATWEKIKGGDQNAFSDFYLWMGLQEKTDEKMVDWFDGKTIKQYVLGDGEKLKDTLLKDKIPVRLTTDNQTIFPFQETLTASNVYKRDLIERRPWRKGDSIIWKSDGRRFILDNVAPGQDGTTIITLGLGGLPQKYMAKIPSDLWKEIAENHDTTEMQRIAHFIEHRDAYLYDLHLENNEWRDITYSREVGDTLNEWIGASITGDNKKKKALSKKLLSMPEVDSSNWDNINKTLVYHVPWIAGDVTAYDLRVPDDARFGEFEGFKENGVPSDDIAAAIVQDKESGNYDLSLVVFKNGSYLGETEITVFASGGPNSGREWNTYDLTVSDEVWEKLHDEIDRDTWDKLGHVIRLNEYLDNDYDDAENKIGSFERSYIEKFDPNDMDAVERDFDMLQKAIAEKKREFLNEYMAVDTEELPYELRHVVDVVEGEQYGSENVSLSLVGYEGGWNGGKMIFESEDRNVHFEVSIDGETAHYDLMTIEGPHEGKGIGTELKHTIEKALVDIGITNFTTLADINVGVYAWAVMGYDYANPRRWVDDAYDFYEYLKKKYKDDPEKWQAIQSDPFIQKVRDGLDNHYGDSHYIRSWEIASWRAPWGSKDGKEFMLHHPSWNGIKVFKGDGWCIGCHYYKLKGWLKDEEDRYCGDSVCGPYASVKSAPPRVLTKDRQKQEQENIPVFAPGWHDENGDDTWMFDEALGTVENAMTAYIKRSLGNPNRKAIKSAVAGETHVRGYWRTDNRTGKRVWVREHTRHIRRREITQELKTNMRYSSFVDLHDGERHEFEIDVSVNEDELVEAMEEGKQVIITGKVRTDDLWNYDVKIKMSANLWMELASGDRALRQELADFIVAGRKLALPTGIFNENSADLFRNAYSKYVDKNKIIKPDDTDWMPYNVIYEDVKLTRGKFNRLKSTIERMGISDDAFAHMLVSMKEELPGGEHLKIHDISGFTNADDSNVLIADFETEDGKIRFGFAITERDGYMYAKGDYMMVHSSLAGKGIGTILAAKSERLAKDMGVTEFRTFADGTSGRYAWAVMGFDFASPDGYVNYAKDWMPKVRKIADLYGINEKQLVKTSTWRKMIEAVKLAETGRTPDAYAIHAWDFATFEVNGVRLGKAAMLEPMGGTWLGVKRIGSKGWEIGCQYYKLQGVTGMEDDC